MKSLLRYELDNLGKIGITLKEFDSLIEMDEYLKQFNDSNDVKEVYLKVINEFLKTPEAIKFLSNIKPSDEKTVFINVDINIYGLGLLSIQILK